MDRWGETHDPIQLFSPSGFLPVEILNASAALLQATSPLLPPLGYQLTKDLDRDLFQREIDTPTPGSRCQDLSPPESCDIKTDLDFFLFFNIPRYGGKIILQPGNKFDQEDG